MSNKDSNKFTVVPGSEDGLRADIESMKRTLPILAELGPQIASIRKALFDSYVEAGFSEAQALELCKNLIIGLLRSIVLTAGLHSRGGTHEGDIGLQEIPIQ